MRIKSLLTVVVLLLSGFPKAAFGCGCTLPLPTDFYASIKMLIGSNSNGSSLVILGQIIGQTQDKKGVRVKIIKNYSGVNNHDTIVVWGSNGVDCRYNLQNQYNAYDTVVLGLNLIETPQNSSEQKGDCWLSVCGQFHLLLLRDSVYGGNIDPNFNGVQLTAFEAKIEGLLNSLEVANHSMVASINVYPNPVTSILTVEAQTGSALTVFSSIGQYLSSTVMTNNEAILQFGSRLPGMYLLRIDLPNGQRKNVLISK